MRITLPFISNFEVSETFGSLVKCSLYKSVRIGDTQHPCLTHIQSSHSLSAFVPVALPQPDPSLVCCSIFFSGQYVTLNRKKKTTKFSSLEISTRSEVTCLITKRLYAVSHDWVPCVEANDTGYYIGRIGISSLLMLRPPT